MGSTARVVEQGTELAIGWPENLRAHLAATGTSQRALARALELNHSSVRDWLRGSRPTGEVRTRLGAWCDAHSLDLDAMLASADIHDLSRERAARRPSPRPSPSKRKGNGGGGAPPPGPPEDDVQILSREYLTPDELEWFGLTVDPFDSDDQPDDLFMPKGLAQIEATLVRAIRGRKLLALVGPAGAGKSAMLRRLWAVSEREKRVRLIAPALMDRRRVTLATLTVAILRDLVERDTSSMAAESRAQLLRTTLANQVQAGMYPTLCVDEAHDLRDDALIALKRLWDSHTLWRQLAIVMVGQPPLAARLRSDPALAELTGRTQLVELPAWGPDAVAAYLDWRVSRVGSQLDQLFSSTAIQAIATRADRPMWINNVAVLALRQARLVGDQQVVPTHVGRI